MFIRARAGFVSLRVIAIPHHSSLRSNACHNYDTERAKPCILATLCILPTHITGQSSNSPDRASLMMYVITPNTGREVSDISSFDGNCSLFPFSGFSR